MSATTFIVGERLPWPDDAPCLPAAGSLEPGAIYDRDARHACLIRKISALGATVGAQVEKGTGESVAIELGNGQRPAAVVAWAAGGELGLAFSQPVDILALINRSLVNQPAERRSMPRVDVRSGAHIRWSGRIEPVRLRNISARGMQIQGEELPPKGSFVSVFVDGLVIPAGELVWQKADLAGIELFEELSWTSLMPWVREQARKGAA